MVAIKNIVKHCVFATFGLQDLSPEPLQNLSKNLLKSRPQKVEFAYIYIYTYIYIYASRALDSPWHMTLSTTMSLSRPHVYTRRVPRHTEEAASSRTKRSRKNALSIQKRQLLR